LGYEFKYGRCNSLHKFIIEHSATINHVPSTALGSPAATPPVLMPDPVPPGVGQSPAPRSNENLDADHDATALRYHTIKDVIRLVTSHELALRNLVQGEQLLKICEEPDMFKEPEAEQAW
jgi:hypothetical protein